MLKTQLKKIAVATIFLTAATSAFSQVRSYVGIVRQKYFPEHIKYFEKYRDELKENGYSTYSKYVDSYLKGGFGSGFVYVGSDGTNYVITNRHVVSQAASASIEFENGENGEITKYDNLKVLLTDDEIDIAILGFENGAKPFSKGLTFSSANVADGQEVWSAGFPGLGSEPVWQLGKGTVTNARARIKELLDPNVSTIIQHSAQIDGGNSGGPLMIASSKGTAGYEVVGINTWKATYRDSTNFSIPAAVIKQMISKAESAKTSASDETALKERSQKLSATLKDLGSDFTSLAKYVSYERASTQGQKDFESVLHFAPSKVRSTVLEAFSFDPAEGLRYASAYQLWKKYGAQSNDGVNYTAGTPKTEDGKTTVDFTSNGEKAETVTTTWIKEHGLWRLSKLSSDEEEKSDSKKSAKKTAKKTDKESKESDGKKSYFGSPEVITFDNLILLGGTDLSINGKDPAFAFGLEVFGETGILGWTLLYHRESVECFTENVGFNIFGTGIVFRIPVKIGNFGLTPYAKGSINLGFGDRRTLFGTTGELGIRAMFNTKGEAHFGFGTAFKQISLTQFMDDDIYRDEEIDDFKNQGVSIYGIISF